MSYKLEALSLAATGNEVFDLSVPDTEKLYRAIKATAKPKVVSRDTTSWEEITQGIKATCAAHTGDGLAILEGAYAHIIGALVNLVRKGDINVEYVPAQGMSISTRTPDCLAFRNNQEFVSEEYLCEQMERALGVAKHLGFSDMEEMRDFIQNAPRNPANQTVTFIVPNETGLHWLYNSGPLKDSHDAANKKLAQAVRGSKEKPSFIFFSREDANIGGYKHILAGQCEPDTSTKKFLVDMKQEGLPVEISAFGHPRRPSESAPPVATPKCSTWSSRLWVN